MAATTSIKTTCPYCGASLDAVTGPDGERPRAKALTICIECCKVSEFDEDLKSRKFDLNRLDPASRMRIEALVRSVRAKLAKKPN